MASSTRSLALLWRAALVGSILALGMSAWAADAKTDGKASGLKTDRKSRVKVQFSDTESGPLVLERGSPLMNRNSDLIPRGGNSLSGVPARPFGEGSSPFAGGSSPMVTTRDRKGTSTTENWLMRPAEDVGLTDENINRALGIRSYDLQQGQGDGGAASAWEPYLKQAGWGSSSTTESREMEKMEERARLLSEPDASDRLNRSALESERLDRHSHDASVPSEVGNRALGVVGVGGDVWSETRRDLVSESLVSFGMTPGAVVQEDLRTTSRAEQFRRILDTHAPLEFSPEASATGGGGIEGAMSGRDLVRQAMEGPSLVPMGSSIPSGSAGLSLRGSLDQASVLGTRLNRRLDSGSLVPVGVGLGSSLPSYSGLAERRSLTFSSPTVLPMPKRNF